MVCSSPIYLYTVADQARQTLNIARKGLLEVKHAPSSSGVLAPGVEGRIVREDGTEADYDEPGELWVHGPNMAPGYYRNEKATREAFVDGWLRTGDTLRVDRQGYL